MLYAAASCFQRLCADTDRCAGNRCKQLNAEIKGFIGIIIANIMAQYALDVEVQCKD